jgi:hypothetical protein
MPPAFLLAGPPAAGKSTVARRLAKRHGLRLYAADTRTWEHRDRAIAAGVAAAIRWEALTVVERWAAPVDELIAMSLHRERAAMIADDIAALPGNTLVVAEGTPIAPRTAPPGSQCLVLVPDAAFQEAEFRRRGLGSGPLALYRTLTTLILEGARAAGVATIEAAGRRPIATVIAEVEARAATLLRRSPVATGREARWSLLREANAALAKQSRDWLARPWTPGEPATLVRDFTCECADPECDAQISLSLSSFDEAAARGPVLVPGHPA